MRNEAMMSRSSITTTVVSIIVTSVVIVCMFCVLVTEGVDFKLSNLFNALSISNERTEISRPVFPRHDLEKELGEDSYRILVATSLGLDGSDNDVISSSKHGVDVSFPTHSLDAFLHQSNDNAFVTQYDDFVSSCYSHYTRAECDSSEKDRLDMCKNQPPVMQNYTTLGFQKLKVPPQLFQIISQFWKLNNAHYILKNNVNNFNQNIQPEKWTRGDTHLNHWQSPTYMLNLQDDIYTGGGMHLRNSIWSQTQSILQSWIGDKYKLLPASLYGIRIYKNGSILAPHVDRLPLVTSAIINVAQDVDEDWPLEVIAHDGKAYNITMQPGEMILYESHSVIHGRPFPLKGRYYANIFIHFEPEGHCLRHADRLDGKLLPDDELDLITTTKHAHHPESTSTSTIEQLYQNTKRSSTTPSSFYNHADLKNEMLEEFASSSQVDDTGIISPYYITDAQKQQRWKQQVQYQHFEVPYTNRITATKNRTSAHRAAAVGDLKSFQKIANEKPSELIAKDENGWQPIHEAARGGHLDIVKFLIEQKVDLNERANNGKGATPLWWSETSNGENHPVSKLLKASGAVSLGPRVGTNNSGKAISNGNTGSSNSNNDNAKEEL